MMDFITYDDDQLDQLRVEVLTEQERRADLERIPALVAQLADTYITATGREQGEPWVQPVGAFDAYPKGWEVTDEGKSWTSLTPFNVWEPGISGWREKTEPGIIPEWVQPSGAHDAYNTGDQVRVDGDGYESLIDNNTWSPADYPAGWKKL